MKKKTTKNMNSSVYAAILAGGIGSRFWPLSRETTPKQLLKVVGDESLLKSTISRLSPVIPTDRVVIVTNESQAELIRMHLHYDGKAMFPGFIVEPVGANTAPAIALAAFELYRKDPEAVMVVLPADHIIEDKKPFQAALMAAVAAAREGHLVTFGIKPTTPETGYGYIKVSSKSDAGKHNGFKVFNVDKFVEKPNITKARKFLRDGGYYWNSGIFIWKASRILEAISVHLPDIYKKLSRATTKEEIEKAYGGITGISIDYGILEKAPGVVMIPADFEWSDMGSWSSFGDTLGYDGDGNLIKGRVVDIGSENSIIMGCDRVVATIGLKDMILVDTPDATLVCPRNRAQEVKDLVGILKKNGCAEHEVHRTVDRPWGSYTLLEHGDRYKIKKISVKPKSRLSLQLHRHRSEHWVVINGTATVQRGDEIFNIKVNQSTYIPLGVKHRLENAGGAPLEIIEVQCGESVDEKDIVRLDDDFSRS